MASLFLTPAAVADQLNNPNLVVIDLGDEHRYSQQHIPGAYPLPFEALVSSRPPVSGLMPDPALVSELLAARGAGKDSEIIAYDDAGGGKSGRLVFTLHAMGFTHCSILDGGWNAWLAAGLATDNGKPEANTAEQVVSPEYIGDNLADRDWILQHLNDDGVALLDTRSLGEFTGESIRAARGGHIPGAAHYEWTDAMDVAHQHALRPTNELLSELEQRGITRDKEVVVYCQTHHRSAHTYALLKHLGFDKVRGYPGAWSDWGNQPDTPVETGA